MHYSPLRYPGGKSKLAAFLGKVCVDNKINGHYVEPYAGGASVALFLLLEGFVKHITINDKDKAIYAFWHSVLKKTDALCELIENTPVDVENWHIQKAIHSNPKHATKLELGFATLFLNRTNRSGIITGGIIGGHGQDGDYLIDCRFNKQSIIDRVRAIAAKRDQITLHNLDALDLIETIQKDAGKKTIFYFDPPYYLKADQLYLNYYDDRDHAAVARKILKMKKINWIVSYDNHEYIKSLYQKSTQKEYTFNHSAGTTKQGKEILFFSKKIEQPDLPDWNPVDFKFVRRKSGRNTVEFRPTKRRQLNS